MSVLELNARLSAWCHVRLVRPLGLDRPRDERGNNSIEMAIIVGVVIVVATLIGIAIKNAVESRLPGMK